MHDPEQMNNMKTKSETFQYGSKIEPIVPGPGLKRQVLGYDGQLMAVKVSFEKGTVGTQHAYYHSQVTYIVSGKFELCIGGKTAVLGAPGTATMSHRTSCTAALAWKTVS